MGGLEYDAVLVPPFLRGSAIGAAIAQHDWSQTPIGPIENWPSTLTSLLGTILASPFPMVLAWGPELITLHNQAYSGLLGVNREVLRRPFPEVWPELRDQLRNMFERVLAGETCHFERTSFTLLRNGAVEEAVFDFGLSPVRDEGGRILGVFNVMAERPQSADRERLSRLFEQAPGFMAMMEGREHRIVLANSAYRRIVGDRDLVGKRVIDALPDAVAQGYRLRIVAIAIFPSDAFDDSCERATSRLPAFCTSASYDRSERHRSKDALRRAPGIEVSGARPNHSHGDPRVRTGCAAFSQTPLVR